MLICQLSVSEDEDVLSEEDVDRILKTYKNPLQLEQFIMEGILILSKLLQFQNFGSIRSSIHTWRGAGGGGEDGGVHCTFQG